jgi:phage shock protein E
MMETLKKLFGLGTSADYEQLVREGALILDVRTKREYDSGHIKGSVNIPVDQLRANLHRLQDKEKPIITCCASGMRSGTARDILQSNGYSRVHNGGSWIGLQQKL